MVPAPTAGGFLHASREVVIRGDAAFRPGCLAAAPDGSVYLTDWADREYSVHQKGADLAYQGNGA